MNNQISHEDFMTIIDEERNYRELKESIRIMKRHLIYLIIKCHLILQSVKKIYIYTENINPKVSKTNNGRAMILSKCAICGSKKSRIIKKQEAKDLLSNLGIKTTLSKIPIVGDVLFRMQFH